MTTAVSNRGSPSQPSPQRESQTPLPTVTDALISRVMEGLDDASDRSAARDKLRGLEGLIRQLESFLADPSHTDAEKSALLTEVFGAGHALTEGLREVRQAVGGSIIGLGIAVLERGAAEARAKATSEVRLRGAELVELGRMIQLIAQGDAEGLARALRESDDPMGTFAHERLDRAELQNLARKLSARLGGPTRVEPSTHWRDMAQVYSSSEFLSRDPETKRRGTFEFSPAAEEIWAQLIEAEPEMRAVYQRLKDALRLANSMLGMIEHDHYALAFVLKFFGDTENDFGEDSEELGYLGMGRVLLAMSSSDPTSIRKVIDEVDVTDANEMYRSFDKEMSEWRSKNEIRPIEDQAGRELLDGLEVAVRRKQEAAGITEDMTLAEQQRRLDAEMERSRASTLAAQRV